MKKYYRNAKQQPKLLKFDDSLRQRRFFLFTGTECNILHNVQLAL